MKISTSKLFLLLTFSLSMSTSSAWACPPIHDLQDVNCDGKFKIAVVGDSIARGSRGNLRAAGSFVKRIGKNFRFATITNLGIPGMDTAMGLRALKKEYSTNIYKVKKAQLNNADFVLVELGLNDYFTTQDIPSTIARLELIVAEIRAYGALHGGQPVVAVALITPVKAVTERRGLQAIFVKKLNKAIIEARSEALPAYVKFNTLPISEIFLDGNHPSTVGHDRLTKILTAYIKERLAPVADTPTPLPSDTPTTTPTTTNTFTPTVTTAPLVFNTPTPTVVATFTNTPSPSPTASATDTPSATPTVTDTPVI